MSYDFDPSEFYRSILSTIQEDDVKTVSGIMLDHVGEERGITLQALAIQAFGEFTTATERKTRLILEELVTKYHMPIGAYSGRPGRWLCANAEEVERVVADLEARRDATNNRIRSLRMAVIPANVPQFSRPRQNSLWQ